MGFYEIESLGRIFSEGAVVAEYKVSAIVQAYDLYRATTQRDFETDRCYYPPMYGSLLTAQGDPGVVSLPEYHYDQSGAYRWKGLDRPTGADPVTDPNCASYDGSLILSGLVRQVAGVNPGKKSFLAGYGKGVLEADQTTYGRRGEPGYWSIPMQARPSQIGGGGLVGGAFDVNAGSDLHPFGSYHNTLKRKKLRTYYGDEVPVPEGTFECFVKPEVDVGVWGRTLPDVVNWKGADPRPGTLVAPQLDGRLHILDWGTASGTSSGRVSKNELRIFTTKGRIFCHWRIKDALGVAKDLVLWKDIAWAAHTWHHVEANWTGATRLFTLGPSGKPVVTVKPGETMFFVDGNLAGRVTLPQDISRGGSFGNESNGMAFSNQDPWLILGGKNYNSTAGWSMGFGDFLGTIDNVFMHKWRLHDRSFLPKSRYLDGSVGELVQAGIDLGEPVGVYVKRLREVEAAAQANTQPLALGTIACTHVHAWHLHAAGHPEGKGHLSPAILLVSGGKQELLHAYDGCSGLALTKAGANVQLRAGDELYYVAGFERRADLPAMTSPILDDFTLTWFGPPKILSLVVDGLP